MKRNKHHIGRLRIRAAAILARQFPEWDVRPEYIVPASGRYRSDRMMDVYRWELFARTRTGLLVVCGSWDTLTRFVRLAAKHGCSVSKDGTIHAKETWRHNHPSPPPCGGRNQGDDK